MLFIINCKDVLKFLLQFDELQGYLCIRLYPNQAKTRLGVIRYTLIVISFFISK